MGPQYYATGVDMTVQQGRGTLLPAEDGNVFVERAVVCSSVGGVLSWASRVRLSTEGVLYRSLTAEQAIAIAEALLKEAMQIKDEATLSDAGEQRRAAD